MSPGARTVPLDFTGGFEYVCIYLWLSLYHLPRLFGAGQTTFEILCLPPSPPHTRSVCSGSSIITSSCGLISPALIFPSLLPNAHIPQSAAVALRALLILTGAISSPNRLENALRVWKAWWVPSDLENFYISYLWETVHSAAIRMIRDWNKARVIPASHTVLSLFERGKNVSTSWLRKPFSKDTSQG